MRLRTNLLCASTILALTTLAGCGKSKMNEQQITALQTALTQLDAQAERVQDISNIKRLQRAYGYYVDKAAGDDVADLFADDGSIEIGQNGVYSGKERVRKYLYMLGDGKTGLQKGQLNEHMQLQPVVHVADDGLTAKGRWRAFIMTGQLGKSANWGEGPYENEYVKQNGVWKIKKLHWYRTFVVPYEGGWAKNKDVSADKEQISKELPPDQPPTEKYDLWPGVHIPPFHFADATQHAAGTAATLTIEPSNDPLVAKLQTSVTALQQRIGKLRDIEDLENLVSIYGYYLDKQQWDKFADLFTADATMEISRRGVYKGKPSIRKALELFGPQNIEQNHVHNHTQLQPVIHVSEDGKTAKIRNRAFSQLGTYGRVGVWMGGVYENEYVKENGVWKIKLDHVFTTYFANYDKGWAFGPGGSAKPSDKIPPDGPSTIEYEAFPDVFVPPYHYKNPVTGGEASSKILTLELPTVPAENVALASLRDRIATIANKTLRLEDERAIINLQRSYGLYVDKALWKETADLFADDGTLEIGGRGVFVGKARVLEYLTWLAPKGLVHGLLFDHMQLQPLVTVAEDGNTAQMRLRFFGQVGEYQKTGVWGMGTYENEYVKQDGIWKIKKLHSFFRMYTPYDKGWAKEARPNTKPEKDLPPDRPPTVVHEQYPDTYIPAYHYKHPVTGK